MAAVEVDDYASAAAAYQSGDYAEAWRIWHPLAESGDVDAQFSLGMLCDRAPPIEGCDAQAAFDWYARAAQTGHRLAQFSLGNAYREGRGVERSETKARYWLEKAAAQGLPAARDALGPASVADLGLSRGGTDEDAAEPAPTRIAPVVIEDSAGVGGDTGWLVTQDPQYYTAQLAAAPDEKGLRDFARRQALGEEVHVICAQALCHLVFGVFASQEAAQAAIDELPAAVLARKPWPRRFSWYQSRGSAAP